VGGYLSDLTGSYQVSFLVCAVAGILGLLLTVLIHAPARKAPEADSG